MSRELSVYGIRELTDREKDIGELAKLCKKLKVDLPCEIMKYFNGDVVPGELINLNIFASISDGAAGYTISIDVADIPTNVKTIKVIYV